MVEFLTLTGPAHWASYLINGDASGLDPEEKEMADRWLDREGVRRVVADDETSERFTWSYALYNPESGAAGGTVLDYLAEMKPPAEIMSNQDAWLYAASWGSCMNSSDPGACLYGFSDDFKVQSEQHRQNCLDHIGQCRKLVLANPQDYDPDELDKMDSFIATLKAAASY